MKSNSLMIDILTPSGGSLRSSWHQGSSPGKRKPTGVNGTSFSLMRGPSHHSHGCLYHLPPGQRIDFPTAWRCVALDHEDSNYAACKSLLFDSLPLAPEQIVTIDPALSPSDAAAAYQASLSLSLSI